ncbi:MerR family DNA-binding transcriptional regulator [Nocardia sp. NPDC050793]|uniref:MerR family DNA-binding transcriptional regulator n=1 Tax=Nocardia sp. NPDC050793 TaxID=3155159 RepID=UPI0034094B55
MSATLRTGQVAAAAGVNVQTLRYYERRGLVSTPDRSLGGHRLYPERTVQLLRVIWPRCSWRPVSLVAGQRCCACHGSSQSVSG